MLEDGNTGVSTEGGAPSAASDSPVVPQTTQSAEVDSGVGTPPASGADVSAAPPAADSGIPENDDDLASLSETERTPLINQRNRIRELNKWRTEVEPVKTWVDQRGGMDHIQADVQMVDQLFSPDLGTRQQFYQTIHSQDPAAFDRLIADVIDTPWVQERFLQSIDPQTVISYAQQAGYLPQDSDADLAVAATIPNELQRVWNSLPAAVRADYGQMKPEMRNWNLQRDAKIYYAEQAERDRAQSERTEQAFQQKSKVYNDVRTIIQQALTEKIPGNQEAMNFVLQATETALYQSPEGAALWNELEHLIDTGQNRGLREKLPLIIAKAKQIATQQATWLNGMESKARQFDELMRLGSYDDIIRYVNQVRGGMKQPGPGTTPQPTNGHGGPRPELAGQYDRDNIMSYFPRS